MYCGFYIFLISIVVAVALGAENVFILQESSEDLPLPFATSSNLEDSFIDDHSSATAAAAANDLFLDTSTPTDVSAGMDGALNNFELVEASCPSKDDQPSKRSRTRRDKMCAPNDQTSIDQLINTLGIFGDPAQREEGLQRAATSSAKADTVSICEPPFLNHLCCQLRDNPMKIPSMPILPTYLGEMHDTMQNCHPGMCNFLSGLKCMTDKN